MSFSKKVVASVRLEYDERLARKNEENEARLDYLHSKIPQLIKIDNELSKTGIKIFSASFGDKETLAQRLEVLKRENLELQEKRASLMEKAGFPVDYTSIKYDCQACRDTGYTQNGICTCYKNALIRKQIEESGFASVIDKCSFENFDLGYYPDKDNMKEILNHLKEYASNFSRSSESILLVGGTGLGKTHLSASVARVLIENGHDVVCESAQNIFSNFNKERFAQSESDLVCDKYFQAELLIIDDLGAEAVTQFSVSCLYNLINTRLNNGIPTIVSTNLSSGEIKKMYNDRITSRLFGEYHILVFTGNDIRKLKK